MARQKTIARLRMDHEIMMAFVDQFVRYCRGLDRGEPQVVAPRQVVDFIDNFIERFHHQREEQVLFEHLMRRSASDRVLARRLVHEHNETRHHIEGMQQVMDMETPDRRTAWVWNGLGYAQLLSDHVKREDCETYPMVAEMLSPEDEALLAERFDRLCPDESLQWALARDFVMRMTKDDREREMSARES